MKVRENARRKSLWIGPLLGTLMGLLFALVPYPLLERWEAATLDLRFLRRGNVPIGKDVVVIGLDDRDLAVYGQWPWSRGNWAELLAWMHQLGIQPSVLVFDVLFIEPQGANLTITRDSWANRALDGDPEDVERFRILETLLAENEREDQALAEALRLHPTLLASYFDLNEKTLEPGRWDNFKLDLLPAAMDGDPGATESLRAVVVLEDALRDRAGTMPDLPLNPDALQAMAAIVIRDTVSSMGGNQSIERAGRMSPPISILSRSASGVGFVNVAKDPDGVVRSTWAVLREGRVDFLSLYLLAVCRHLEVDLSEVRVVPDKHIILPGRNRNLFIPIDRQGRLAVNFRGPDAFLYPPNCLSFRGVAAGLQYMMENGTPPAPGSGIFDPRSLHGAVVLIGMYAEGAPDFGIVPTSAHYPRVAIHANAIDTILSEDHLLPPARIQRLLVLVLTVFFGVTCGASVRYLSPIRGGIGTLALLGIYPVTVFQSFITFNFVLPMVRPSLAVAATFAANAAYYFLVERRERRRYGEFVRSHFPRPVAELFLSGEKELDLSGQRAKLTVLFADIRGFTSLSERLPPEEVVLLLNRFFGEMVEIIHAHGGTLDKFMGDAIMVFFGHPVSHPDDALRAVRMAHEMRERMERLREEWIREGKEGLGIGIGISTGEAVVGDVGTRSHQEYTAIGPHVNLAFRLQGQAPAGTVLLSETTCLEVRDQVDLKPLDPIMVKGFSEPIPICALLGVREEHSGIDPFPEQKRPGFPRRRFSLGRKRK